MAYPKGDPRNKYTYRFRVGEDVEVTTRFTAAGRTTRKGKVTRQFIPCGRRGRRSSASRSREAHPS